MKEPCSLCGSKFRMIKLILNEVVKMLGSVMICLKCVMICLTWDDYSFSFSFLSDKGSSDLHHLVSYLLMQFLSVIAKIKLTSDCVFKTARN